MWDFIKKNWAKILLLVFGLVIIILLMNTTCINRKNNNLANNIKALTDSMQIIEGKNGDLIYARQSLILEKNELENYLDISNKEVKRLEKELDSKIALISKMQGMVVVDTLVMYDSIYIHEDTTIVQFNYKDNWLAMDGTTVITNYKPKTVINSITSEVPLKIGMTDDYKIFATTDNPYVKFTDIESSIISGSKLNEKKKNWNVGLQVGFGGGFDLISKRVTVGPYIGAGISYGFDF